MNLKFYLRGLGIGIIVTAIIMLVISYQNRTTLTDAQIKARAAELGMVDESTSLANMAQTNLENMNNNQDTSSENNTADGNDTSSSGDESSEASQTSEASEAESPEADVQLVESPEDIPQADTNLDLNGVEDVLDQADAYLESKNDPNAKKNKVTKEPSPTKEPEVSKEPEKTKEPSPSKAPEATKAPEKTKEPEASKEPEKTKEPSPSKAPETTATSEGDIKLVVSKGESSYTVAKHLADLGLIDNANDFDTYLCSVGKDRYISTGTYNLSKGMTKEEIASKIAR